MDASNQTMVHNDQTEPYRRLSDADLRTAIRFAKSHLRSVAQNHHVLCRAYRREIATMRRLLVRRGSRPEPACRASLSDRQRALDSRFRALGTPAGRVRSLVRAASRGRTDQVRALTDVEAIALLFCLVPQR